MAQNTRPQHSTLTVKGRAVRIRTIGVGVLAVLAIWFIAANTGSVSVKLWVPTVTLPLWAVLTVTLLVGMVIGFFLARRRSRRDATRNR
ncbi:LapA family protein [Kitasatospora sp. NPDC050543]|uniref:LapA family protein n=1 Tax=Kitasatospora sp. NPDC050543 TaxID=3364054 RepID=UPI0037A36EA7